MQLSLIELGLWLSLPLIGYLVFQPASARLFPALAGLPAFTRFSLMVATGITVWSFPLLGTAICGIYRSDVFGWAGWIITLAALWTLRRTFHLTYSSAKVWVSEQLTLWNLIYITGLMALCILYFHYPNESVLGGRDQGVYANHAVYIANHGQLSLDYPIPYDLFNWPKGYLHGLYATAGKITVQFGHLFPVWLAYAYNTFGINGLFGLNPFLALLSLGLFRGLLQSFVGTPYAVMGALFLGFNISQIWLARITLTEIMAQFWVMAALLTANLAVRENNRMLAGWSGVFWGMTTFCRIDSFLFIPLLVMAHWVTRFLGKDDDSHWKKFWLWVYLGSIPIFVLAVAYYYFFSRPYFFDLSGQLIMIGGLLALSVLGHVIWCFVSINVSSRSVKGSLLFGVFSLFIILSFLYGHLIRPYVGSFSTIHWPGHVLDGTRTYRENTIVNLGMYLSAPGLYLSLGGWLLAVWQLWFLRRIQWLLPVVIMGAFTAAYLYDPNISPDHYWTIRRFVPVSIPGFVFFGAVGLAQLLKGMGNKKHQGIVAVVFITVLFLFTYQLDKPVATHAENGGSWGQLSQLANKIPDDGVVFEPFQENYNVPLFMAFDKRIMPVFGDFGNKEQLDLIRELTEKGIPVYLLTDSRQIAIYGYETKKVDQFLFNRDFMEIEYNSLPKDVLHEEKRITLYRINPAGEAQLNHFTFGAYRLYGLPERGFYDTEFNPSGSPFRWTNGEAELSLPWSGQEPPKNLHVSLVSTGPRGTELTIKVNGQALITEHLNPGQWEGVIPLESIELQSPVKVELESTAWKPSEVIPESDDIRPLGVAVGLVQLRDQTVDITEGALLGKEIARSEMNLTDDVGIEIDKGQTSPISLKLTNKSEVPWSGQAKADDGSVGPIKLGVIWFNKHEPGKKLAEDRSELPYTLYPGDEANLQASLYPVGYDGAPLPPGDYEVWIGPVQEGVFWFYERGDNVVKLDVKVLQ